MKRCSMSWMVCRNLSSTRCADLRQLEMKAASWRVNSAVSPASVPGVDVGGRVRLSCPSLLVWGEMTSNITRALKRVEIR